MQRRACLALLAGLPLALNLNPAFGDGFPDRPIRIIQGPKTLLRDPVSLFIDPEYVSGQK